MKYVYGKYKQGENSGNYGFRVSSGEIDTSCFIGGGHVFENEAAVVLKLIDAFVELEESGNNDMHTLTVIKNAKLLSGLLLIGLQQREAQDEPKIKKSSAT